jgi:hypothetical protein
MPLDSCIQSIRSGEWSSSRLRDEFYQNLIGSKANGNESAITNPPLCMLTAARYRKLPMISGWQVPRAAVGTIQLINGQSDPLAEIITQVLPARVNLLKNTDTGIAAYQMAADSIESICPMTWREIQLVVDFIATADTQDYRSCSSPHALGCIIISSRGQKTNISELATSLVHEMAHQELFLVNLLDRLIISDADNQSTHSPYQNRARPPIGRLHSMAALSRMIQFRRRAELNVTDMEKLLIDTSDSLPNTILTTFGIDLKNAYYESAFS